VTHRHEPPPSAALAPLAGRRLYRAVEVGAHRGAPVLRYHDRDVSLDLGAIAKGYGVDRAVDALRRHGIRQAVVDVGGDLYALGESNDGEPWRIGIQDPDDARALVGTIEVRDAAIATSGTYLQYFRWRGARYHHLMDPATAAPRETRTRSLTIRADCCMHADVAATALYGMSVTEGNALLRRVAPGGSIVSML
jgi:thiamine biosynthesis lipoprotein